MKGFQKSFSTTSFSSPKKYPSAPKQLPPNRISIETLKKNKLNSRVTPFIDKYNSTDRWNRQKSVCIQLADSIYKNSFPDIKKHKQENAQDSEANPNTQRVPEMGNRSSVVLNNLHSKTQKVPEYNVFVLDLTKQKNFLTEKIEVLKRKIYNENKATGALRHSHNKIHNSIDQNKMLFEKTKGEADKAAKFANLTAVQCSQLRSDINSLNESVAHLRQNNQKQSNHVKALQQECIQTKKSTIVEDRKLTQLKTNLTVALKGMNTNAATIKNLEGQRAEVLLYINKETESNRIKV